MTCNCIEDLNRQLDGQEVESSITTSLDLKTMSMVTYAPLIRKDTQKRENRRKMPTIAAHAFCPFCGKPYCRDNRTPTSPPSYASLEEMQEWAASVMSRKRDFHIGDEFEPYMERWWIIPRNEQQNVYLHRILRDDDDRALHDHPWENVSYVIAGSYREITPDGVFIRQPGDVIKRQATDLHRLELIGGEPCISIFMTGQKTREWGFDCPNGWVHWKDFTAGDNGELVGRGCGEQA